MTTSDNVQWLTTVPSGKAHTCVMDDGVTGWKRHAVMANESQSFSEIAEQRSMCGLLPKHGWGSDLFIPDEKRYRCLRCLRKAESR